jgi:hypothetical protein
MGLLERSITPKLLSKVKDLKEKDKEEWYKLINLFKNNKNRAMKGFVLFCFVSFCSYFDVISIYLIKIDIREIFLSYLFFKTKNSKTKNNTQNI